MMRPEFEIAARFKGQFPIVCFEAAHVREFLRAARGHVTDRRPKRRDAETQRAVAVKAGVPLQTVAKAESRSGAVSLDSLRRIAAVHGYETAIVFTKKGSS